MAVNSFGVGGANGHCLMKSYTQQKKGPQLLEEKLPRLVIVSARNESAITFMINRVLFKHFPKLLNISNQCYIYIYHRSTNYPEMKNSTLCYMEFKVKILLATNIEDTFYLTACTTKLVRLR